MVLYNIHKNKGY